MSTTQIILLAVIGLIGGILSGSLGVGGGVIIIPSLILFFGLTQHEAQGTFIGMAVFPVQILAAWSYYKAGNLDWRIALVLLLTFTLGSYFGAHLTNKFISDLVLKKIFGILMLVTAIKMIFF